MTVHEIAAVFNEHKHMEHDGWVGGYYGVTDGFKIYSTSEAESLAKHILAEAKKINQRNNRARTHTRFFSFPRSG